MHPLPPLLPGEPHPQPPTGRRGLHEQRPEPAVQRLGGVDGPARVGAGLDEPVQGDDERGGAGLGVVDVDTDGDGLPHGLGDLPGGGERLIGRLLPDPGDLPQPVPVGRQHVPHKAVPGRLDHAEPQPPLGDVLEPRDRYRRELAAGQLVVQRSEGGPDGLDGPPMIPEDALRGPMQRDPNAEHLPRPPPTRYGPRTHCHAAPRCFCHCVAGIFPRGRGRGVVLRRRPADCAVVVRALRSALWGASFPGRPGRVTTETCRARHPPLTAAKRSAHRPDRRWHRDPVHRRRCAKPPRRERVRR